MKLDNRDEHFLEDIAALMQPWGWPRPVGRIYGYLLLRAEPATLDEIAADLCMSKSNASVAARTLEHCGNARRQGMPGTKRITYAIPASHAGPFEAKAELLGRLARLFAGEARRSPEGADAVGARFDSLAGFLGDMRDAIEGVIATRGDQAGSATRTGAGAAESPSSRSATRAR